MKKFLLFYLNFLFLSVAVSGCTDLEQLDNSVPSKFFFDADDTTLEIIKNEIGYADNLTRSSSNTSIVPYVYDEDTVMYIVNYSEGWDIFSSNKYVPMILASSEKGNINLQDTSLTSIFKLYMDDLAEYVHTARGEESYGNWKAYDSTIKTKELNEILQSATTADVNTEGWPIVVDHDSVMGRGGWSNPELVSTSIDTIVLVPHFIRTTWHQKKPWNVYRPIVNGLHKEVGCSAVALGQFLYYTHNTYRVPSKMPSKAVLNPSTGDYSFSNMSSTVWNRMALLESEPGHKRDSAALMLGYIAQAIGTYHSAEGNFIASNVNVMNFLYLNGINVTNRVYPTYSAISTLIRQHRPLIAEIYDSNYEDGHMLIIDAIMKTKKTTRYRYGWLGLDQDGNLAMTFDNNGRVSQYKYISYKDIETYDERIQMNWGTDNFVTHLDEGWFPLKAGEAWPTEDHSYGRHYVWLWDFVR